MDMLSSERNRLAIHYFLLGTLIIREVHQQLRLHLNAR